MVPARKPPAVARGVRIFVSSTFRDMFAEREELVKRVFPPVRRLCEQRGASWSEIDLRWGITEAEAARGQVVPLCLAEAGRCTVFLGLLGDRYGWIPGAAALSAELLQTYPWLADHADDSVTEMEIWHGALTPPPESPRPSFFYFRQPQDANRAGQDESPTAQRRQAALKEAIRRSGLPVREPYRDAEELGRLVAADLATVVERLYPAHVAGDPLAEEEAAHRIFAGHLARNYAGRAGDFERLDRHAAGLGRPLVVHGAPGCGKSALLSAWALRWLGEELAGVRLRAPWWSRWLRWLRPAPRRPDALFLLHLVGATSAATTWPGLVRRVLAALKSHFRLTQPLPDQPAALSLALPQWLSLAAARGRVILVLDGLDHLQGGDPAAGLSWLPAELPANVRLVVSAAPGPTLTRLRERAWRSLEVRPLDPAERGHVLAGYLGAFGKKLAAAPLRQIVEAPQAAQPLYLRTLAEELRVFGRHEEVAAQVASCLETPNVTALFERMLARLEGDYSGERPGLVDDSLSLLATARHGLAEAELLDLLGDDAPLPAARWLPLAAALRESLVDQAGRLTFFHPALKAAVERRYLTGADAGRLHRRLADYFRSRPWSLRKVEEWPWQLVELGAWAELRDVLTDANFLRWAWPMHAAEVKVYATLVGAQTGATLVDLFAPVLLNPADRAEGAWPVAALLSEAGHPREALALAGRLTEDARGRGDNEALLRGLALRAGSLQALGETAAALEVLREHESLCRGGGTDSSRAANLANQGVLLRALGKWDQAADYQRQAEALYRRSEDFVGLADTLLNQAVLWIERGQRQQAWALLQEHERVCRASGDLAGLQRGLGNQATLRSAEGRWDAALILHAEEEQICRRLGDRVGLHVCLGNQALALRPLADYDGAKEKLDEKERICRELGDPAGLIDALKGKALLFAVSLKMPSEAVPLLRQAHAVAVKAGLDGQRQDVERLLAGEPGEAIP